MNAVRLMLKSKKAEKKIEDGDLNTTNAAHANRALQGCKDDKKKNDSGFVDKLIDEASSKSTRDFNKYLDKEFKRPRKETVTLDEGTLDKFDRLRKEYGDLTTYELIQVLLEEKLKAPGALRRHQRVRPKNSRSIPKSVKAKVWTGKCKQCGVRHNLEYDHVAKYSHGGTNSASNIQVLCRSCNQRKEIRAKQTHLFT